jgi:hypothetical protein
MPNGISDVWFYVNPETESVDAAFYMFPLGISMRQNKDWEFMRRDETGIDSTYAGHDIWELNWDADEVEMTEDFDFDDYDLNTPTALKMFDEGTLTLESLKEYAKPYRTSKGFVPSEE